MKLTLEGRTALVTGANGGLGSHFAQTLGQGGGQGRRCRAARGFAARRA